MSLADDIARTILEGFDEYYRRFREICAAAKERFERADWAAMREANRVRIDMYDQRVQQVTARVQELFPEAATTEKLWLQIKQAYIPLLYDHKRPECAETFYNSIACRVLSRTYYRNEYIFWRPAVSTEFIEGELPTYRCFYPAEQGVRRTMLEIIRSFDLRLPFQDLRRGLRDVLRALRGPRGAKVERHPNFQVQVLSSLLFRNKNAFLVGRIINGNQAQPFAVPIRHVPGGGALYLDALLQEPAHIAALFSLSRLYVQVHMEVPSATVGFFRELVPGKPTAELYTMVGLHKQGKTLFYRDLFWHLKHSNDRFAVAPGARGMVMLVFTLPSFPYVFKLIRDRFPPPKDTTREEVMQKYLLVKHHDRVGRMADTLEYSDVAFPLARIDPELLRELQESCGSMVEVDGAQLVIRHLYIERRMVPLDIWLRDADEERARHGVGELGRAIKDLTSVNIFPGDLLLKNFGITRWGRAVFYDYDEICLLTDVSFRRLPAPSSHDEEMASEPWFSVGPRDVFPEELPTFLFPPGRQRELFLELHPELTDPGWWLARQEERRAGKETDFVPYPEETRFTTHRRARAAVTRTERTSTGSDR